MWCINWTDTGNKSGSMSWSWAYPTLLFLLSLLVLPLLLPEPETQITLSVFFMSFCDFYVFFCDFVCFSVILCVWLTSPVRSAELSLSLSSPSPSTVSPPCPSSPSPPSASPVLLECSPPFDAFLHPSEGEEEEIESHVTLLTETCGTISATGLRVETEPELWPRSHPCWFVGFPRQRWLCGTQNPAWWEKRLRNYTFKNRNVLFFFSVRNPDYLFFIPAFSLCGQKCLSCEADLH